MSLENIFQIEVDSSIRNQDKAYRVLKNSGLPFIDLENNKYVVCLNHLNKFDAEEIKYKLLRLWYE